MSSFAVAGASRGIGYEFIVQLSSEPSNTVFALVRNPDGATKLQALARERNNIHVIKTDVSDPRSLVQAAEATSAITNGKLDVLIHNAVSHDPSLANLTASQLPLDTDKMYAAFKGTLETGIFGATWSTNAFLPLIEKGTQKKIIFMSSPMGDMDFVRQTGISNAVIYGVEKASLNILAAKYAAELAPKNINVLALSPGWVDTIEKQGPPSAELQVFFESLVNKFRRVKPDVQGPMTTPESVQQQLEVITALDGNLSGKFVSHHGDQNWF